MTDLQKLIAEARAATDACDHIEAFNWMAHLADALEALNRESEALQAQLDSMTTEWSVTVPAMYDKPGDNITTEESAKSTVREALTAQRKWAHGNPAVASSRLVGPWVEVTDE